MKKKELNAPPLENDSPVEFIKERSNFLRGTILEGLDDRITGAVHPDDTQLTKFHGTYMQDDRELRVERQKQKLEPLYSFMIRARTPGGVCDAEQWLAMDRLANTLANGTLKLTTRQAFQFHGVFKTDLWETMNGIIDCGLDSLAACGDVNRNVMCNPNPYQSYLHEEVYDWSVKISEHLLPHTRAYFEMWADGKKIVGTPQVAESETETDSEPVYGKHYLPRKFKIGIAVPPSNDVDVYSQDLGFIAIEEDGKLAGFNVLVGGGMGMTHGDTATYPRLADEIGFVTLDQVLAVSEAVVTTQRDYGDRTSRKHARLKYTIDEGGLDWFKGEVEQRSGVTFAAAKPFEFTGNGDLYGWNEGTNGKFNYSLFVEGGRVKDTEDYPMMTGLREIAKIHDGDFRLSSNQNLVIGNISPGKKSEIEALMQQYGLADKNNQSGLRLTSIACVALPTCGLAMAEAERYLPVMIDKLDAIMADCGLAEDPIVIRMTGCPNGCGRPYLGEIGFVGKAPGKYNLYLGAGFSGDRLNKLYRENIGEEEILTELDAMIRRYAKEREEGERFGDFVIRAGYVKATTEGLDFHS